jgi:hypothetical protein
VFGVAAVLHPLHVACRTCQSHVDLMSLQEAKVTAATQHIKQFKALGDMLLDQRWAEVRLSAALPQLKQDAANVCVEAEAKVSRRWRGGFNVC